MRLLVDTNILIWATSRPSRIPPGWRGRIASESDEVFFSIVSVWEVAIKSGLGRPDFMVEPDVMLSAALRQGFDLVPLTLDAVLAVKDMPPHHRDPFDRIMIAQAHAIEAVFLTGDRSLSAYGAGVVVL